MKSNKVLKVLAIMAMLFGAATILSGGKALFGGVEARTAVGDAVPFVLWFNFLAGFLYVSTGFGLFLRKPWSVIASVVLAVSTLAVFVAFGLHVAGGGAFEVRTVAAMSIRTFFWATVSLVSWRALGGRTGMGGMGGLRGSVVMSLLLIASVLMACNKPSHSHTEKQEAAATPNSVHSLSAKWQADSSTNAGIEKMQEMVKSFESSANVEALKQALGNEVALILKSCTMQGEAHEHLHHFLIPLKEKIDGLKNENGSTSLSDLSGYLSTYWDHFKR